MSHPNGMDPETYRRNYGWFGSPWPSGICYNDDGTPRNDIHIPTPIGEKCLSCKEPFEDGDQGKAMPLVDDHPRIVHTHRECLLMEIVGPLAHLQGKCTGRCQCTDDTGMTFRQEALAVQEWISNNASFIREP